MKNKAVTLSLSLIFAITQFLGFCTPIFANTSQEVKSAVNSGVKDKMENSYTVTVPENIDFGDLSPNEEQKRRYTLNVTFDNENSGDLKIVSPKEILLKNDINDNFILSAKNNLGETSVVSANNVNSYISIDEKQIKQAQIGNYTGILQFEFSYNTDEIINSDYAEVITTNNSIVNKLKISNGLNSLTQNITNGKIFFIADYLSEDKQNISDDIIKYYPNEELSNIENNNRQSIIQINEYINTNNQIKERNGKLLQIYSFDIVKEENGIKELVNQTDNVLEIRVPLDRSKIDEDKKLLISRVHNGECEAFEPLSTRPNKNSYKDATFFVGYDCIYVYADKFSRYSLIQLDKDLAEPVVLADYTVVDNILKKVPSNLAIYSTESVQALQNAINNVVRGLDSSKQNEVDKMAKDIEIAIKNLVKMMSDYTKVDNAIAKIPANLSIYTDESAQKVIDAKNAIKYKLDISHQAEVDKMAENLENAISELQLKIQPILENGKYTATVSMRKDGNFAEKSMCDSLFSSVADLEVDGDNTTLTLRVIDPIPNYEKDGTPLKNIKLIYDGQSYDATLDSVNKQLRTFPPDNRFIFKEGSFETSTITVTVPTKAIIDSSTGSLTGTAFVNVAMKIDVSFIISLTDFVKGESQESEKTDNTVSSKPTITTPSSSKPSSVTKPNNKPGNSVTTPSTGTTSSDVSNDTSSDTSSDSTPTNPSDEPQEKPSYNDDTVIVYGQSVFIIVIFILLIVAVLAICGYCLYKIYRRK